MMPERHTSLAMVLVLWIALYNWRVQSCIDLNLSYMIMYTRVNTYKKESTLTFDTTSAHVSFPAEVGTSPEGHVEACTRIDERPLLGYSTLVVPHATVASRLVMGFQPARCQGSEDAREEYTARIPARCSVPGPRCARQVAGFCRDRERRRGVGTHLGGAVDERTMEDNMREVHIRPGPGEADWPATSGTWFVASKRQDMSTV